MFSEMQANHCLGVQGLWLWFLDYVTIYPAKIPTCGYLWCLIVVISINNAKRNDLQNSLVFLRRHIGKINCRMFHVATFGLRLFCLEILPGASKNCDQSPEKLVPHDPGRASRSSSCTGSWIKAMRLCEVWDLADDMIAWSYFFLVMGLDNCIVAPELFNAMMIKLKNWGFIE